MASIYKVSTGWRAQVRVKHKPTVSKILPSKREAQAWAREQEHAIHVLAQSASMLTFSSILAKYEEHARVGGLTKQYALKRLEKYWGDWRMPEINSGAISDYAKRRRDSGAAPSTVLQDLSYMSTVLGHGGVLAGSREASIARMELKAAVLSLRHTGTVADSTERDRRPTDEELERLVHWFAARSRTRLPMADIILFAVATCMRQGEIVGSGGIVWEDFDPANRTIWVRKRKDPRRPGGRDDCVPLILGTVTFAGNVVDPVDIMDRQPTAYIKLGRVFPFPEQRVCTMFSQACDILKIEDLRFHDLRHDGISRLFEAGYDIPQVSAISGHKSWKNLKRYTHLQPKFVTPTQLRTSTGNLSSY